MKVNKEIKDCFDEILYRRRFTKGEPMEYGAEKEAIFFQCFIHAGHANN